MTLKLRLAILIPLALSAFAQLYLVPGIDLGWGGSLAVLVGAWVVWYLLWKALHEWSARSRAEEGAAMPSPGEWRAWIGAAFSAAIGFYLLTHSPQMVAPDGSMAPAARTIGGHIAILVIVWLMVMQILRKHWRDIVQLDERDRAIEARACAWARGALVVSLIALAVMFGFSPSDHLQWAQPMVLSNVFVGGLIASSLLEYLVTEFSYWRDRRELTR